MRVYIQPGCAEPETLVEALVRRGPAVRDVEIVHMMTMGCAPYVAPEMEGHFRHNAVFIGANVRDAINDGRADYTPIYLSEIEGLFEAARCRSMSRSSRSLPRIRTAFAALAWAWIPRSPPPSALAGWWRRSMTRCPEPMATASST
jgi:acyl-CoA hydrolase